MRDAELGLASISARTPRPPALPPHSVGIYSGKTGKLLRGVGRFDGVVHSAALRGDGKLLVAGEDNGRVQVFDSASKDILRLFKGHRGPVHGTCFASDNKAIMTAGDDRSTRMWDLATGAVVAEFDDHADYVRALDVSPASGSVWATGSYDHTVRLWDGRGGSSASACSLRVDHGDPVTAVRLLRGGMLLATAGGPTVKVWDLMAGGRLVAALTGHQKLVTALALDGSGDRLLSGGLDHVVNVYETVQWSVAHSWTVQAPVLSLGVSPSNTQLVIGTMDKALTVRTREVSQSASVVEEAALKVIRGGSYKYFMRGQGATPSAEDSQADRSAKPKLAGYDRLLRKFKYSAALDAALSTGNPIIVYSLLQELRARDGLRSALSGRNEEALEPVLAFLVRYLVNPRYAALLLDVAELLLLQYGGVIGTSPSCDTLWRRLLAVMRGEVALQQDLLALQGALDALIAASSTAITAAQASAAAAAASGGSDDWIAGAGGAGEGHGGGEEAAAVSDTAGVFAGGSDSDTPDSESDADLAEVAAPPQDTPRQPFIPGVTGKVPPQPAKSPASGRKRSSKGGKRGTKRGSNNGGGGARRSSRGTKRTRG